MRPLLFLLLVLNITLAIFFAAANHFTGVGIDSSVFYQLSVGVTGLSWRILTPVVIFTVGYFCLLAALLAATSKLALFRKFSGARGWLAILVLGACLLANPALWQTYAAVSPLLSHDSSGIATLPDGRTLDFNQLHANTANLEAPGKRKNFIYIYAEGLDRTFFDHPAYAQTLPRLRKLQTSAINFTNIMSPWGAGWTIAGIVGSQCGIPLVASPVAGNDFGNFGAFLPEATCITDQFKKNGYDLTFIQGASLSFAGKGAYLKSHGFSHTFGLDELAGPDEPLSSWGRHDAATFKSALARYRELRQSETPFGLVVLTVDTHPPSGHPGPGCKDAPGGDRMRAALSCSDALIADFIETVLREDDVDETVIILGSDHPMMRNTLTEYAYTTDRRNAFMIWNAHERAGQARDITRAGTVLDIGATVATALGFSSSRQGLGVDLFGPSPTLLETAGDIDSLNAALPQWAPSLMAFWQDSSPWLGFQFDRENQRIRFGAQSANLPLTIVRDKKTDAIETVFGAAAITAASAVNTNKSFLIVESCTLINADIFGADLAPRDDCYVYYDSGKLYSAPLPSGAVLLPADLMARGRLPQSFQKAGLRRLGFYAAHGTLPEMFHSVNTSGKTPARIKIVSAGFEGGAISYVRADGQEPVELVERGLNILHMDRDGTLHVLGSVDTCGGQSAQPLLQDLETRSQLGDGAVLIVGFDSVRCEAPLGDLKFRGHSLTQLRDIALREPYIASIDQNGAREFRGVRRHPLVVDWRPGLPAKADAPTQQPQDRG